MVEDGVGLVLESAFDKVRDLAGAALELNGVNDLRDADGNEPDSGDQGQCGDRVGGIDDQDDAAEAEHYPEQHGPAATRRSRGEAGHDASDAGDDPACADPNCQEQNGFQLISQADHAEDDGEDARDDTDKPCPAPQVWCEREDDLHQAAEQQINPKEDSEDQQSLPWPCQDDGARGYGGDSEPEDV